MVEDPQPAPRSHALRGRPAIGKVGRGVATRRCNDPASAAFLRGLEEFNRQQFYQCHETLEALWLQEQDPIRYLYQGILQIGVGFYHLNRGNYRGAVSLLGRGLRLLRPFAPTCLSVDVARLIAEADGCRDRLLALGPERLQEVEPGLIPKIALAVSPPPLSTSAPPQGGALSQPSAGRAE